MGECVGELFYGVEITKEQAKNLISRFNVKHYGYLSSKFPPDLGLEFYRPYETDNYFIKGKDASLNFSEWDSGSFVAAELLEHIHTKNKIIEFCKEHSIEIDISKIGWCLSGHYN